MSTFGRFCCKVWQFCRILQSFVNYYNVTISARHLLWIYRRLIGRPYIALARQAEVYRNISDPLGRLATNTLHCNALQYITLHSKRGSTSISSNNNLHIWTYFQHHHSLLLSALLIQLIPQNSIQLPIFNLQYGHHFGSIILDFLLCFAKNNMCVLIALVLYSTPLHWVISNTYQIHL